MNTDLDAMQADMRRAYCGGGAGMLASSLVWIGAGLVAMGGDAQHAIWTLLVGGMFIHPLGVLFARLGGRSGAHRNGNALAWLAAASTIGMIASLPLAYAASRLHVEWFFPAMLLVIGSRYLSFETLYGLRVYRVCGFALLAAGVLTGYLRLPPSVGAAAGGAIEAGFTVAILLRDRAVVAATGTA
jgi:hypothetical protein